MSLYFSEANLSTYLHLIENQSTWRPCKEFPLNNLSRVETSATYGMQLLHLYVTGIIQPRQKMSANSIHHHIYWTVLPVLPDGQSQIITFAFTISHFPRSESHETEQKKNAISMALMNKGEFTAPPFSSDPLPTYKNTHIYI